MITAKLLILCALLGLVSAECGTGGTATVTGNPEKTLWEGSGCKTYTGSIVLATDNPSWGFVSFPELEEVTGSITAHENRNLTGFTLTELRKAEELSLKDPGATEDYLLALVVPHLEHLENLEWSQLHHESGLIWAINITEITNFVINDTRLYTLHDEEYPEYSSFRSLTTAATVRIERNHELPEIKLPALITVTDSLTIRHNSLNRHIYFPMLEWAGSITVYRNGGFLNSRQNTSVDLPSITEVKSLFNISENSLLNNIFVPLLQNVGGDLVIENNTDLQNLSFPNLERVSGDVLIRGNNISRIELPALKSIDGSLTIQTFNCSQLEDIKPLVSGYFSCENATDSSSNPNIWATQTITVPSATSQPQTGTGSSICQTDYLGLIIIVAVPILVMEGSRFLSLFDLLNQ